MSSLYNTSYTVKCFVMNIQGGMTICHAWVTAQSLVEFQQWTAAVMVFIVNAPYSVIFSSADPSLTAIKVIPILMKLEKWDSTEWFIIM